jgi:hypothetical protein
VFLVVGGLVGLLAGLVAGGSLSNLHYIRFRWPLAVVVTLVARDLVAFPAFAHLAIEPAIYSLALFGLIVWTLWHHDQIPGIWIVSVGMALNLVVILANAGHMPVPVELSGSGPPELARTGVLGHYVLSGPQTRLPWLGDWIALPGPIGHIFPQAYSPGDLVAFVGIGVVLFLGVLGGSYYSAVRARS